MKLVTIEKTREDTLISLIKGFMWGGGGSKYQSCDLSEFSPLFSHRHTNTRDLFITHLPPKHISNDERKRKNYGNLVNDNKNEEKHENE